MYLRERDCYTEKKMSSQLTGSHGGIELVSITANIQTLTGKYAWNLAVVLLLCCSSSQEEQQCPMGRILSQHTHPQTMLFCWERALTKNHLIEEKKNGLTERREFSELMLCYWFWNDSIWGSFFLSFFFRSPNFCCCLNQDRVGLYKLRGVFCVCCHHVAVAITWHSTKRQSVVMLDRLPVFE